MQLPNAASLERTAAASREVEKILATTPGVQYYTSVVGFSLLSFVRTSYNAFFFVTLKPWGDRKTRAEQYQEIKARLNQQLGSLPQGTVFSFSPPAIPGVGTSGGFQFVLEDRAGRDVQFLADNLDRFLAAARKRPEIGSISTTFLPSVPQEFVDVDRDKVLKQGVAISDVYRTIQAFMGGQFINYFNDFGRTWQVYVEAEAPLPGESGERGTVLRAQQQRRDGAAFRAGEVRVARTAPSSPCATTSTAPRKSTAAPRPATAPTRPRRRSKTSSSKPCPAKWATTTWACPIRSRRRGKGSRLRSSSGSRCCSCS